VRHLSANLSSLKAADFAAKLSGLFQKNGDSEDTTLTLCRIRLPIAGNPLLTALMKLDLHILASGKAECVLTQECEAGFESRHGKVRMIRSFDHDEKAAVHADTKTTADIRVSLDLVRKALMDITVNAGVKASCDTVLHLYDNETSRTSGTAVPPDFAAEAAESNPDVLVCADLKGNWILDVLVNSSSTAAGMLGLSGKVSLLNEKNNTLIPSLCGHFENGHKVSHCTRHDRIVLQDPEEIQVSDKIRLSSYALILMKGETKEIVIKGLPEGYSTDDLEFISSDPSVAAADSSGILYGTGSGSAKITVRTADQMHASYLSVITVETAG
nr:Ig-like domain-containing protein [Solobacterium sp.]